MARLRGVYNAPCSQLGRRSRFAKVSVSMNIRRILTPGSILCILFCIFILGYGPAIGALLYTRWDARDKPELWIVPMPLTDLSVAQSTGETFSYLGYEFESPWAGVKSEKKYESIAIVYFSDGGFISIAKGPDLIRTMQEDATKRRRTIKDVFGAEATHSNYALRSTILHLTPRDLRLFSSPREMVANSVLLMLKPMSVTTAKSGLYSFQTERLRGFEEGTPGQANPVKIDALDEKDCEMDLLIGTQPHTSGTVSQADINRVLFSLRPVGPAPMK
jgi:hypothetical protein